MKLNARSHKLNDAILTIIFHPKNFKTVFRVPHGSFMIYSGHFLESERRSHYRSRNIFFYSESSPIGCTAESARKTQSRPFRAYYPKISPPQCRFCTRHWAPGNSSCLKENGAKTAGTPGHLMTPIYWSLRARRDSDALCRKKTTRSFLAWASFAFGLPSVLRGASINVCYSHFVLPKVTWTIKSIGVNSKIICETKQKSNICDTIQKIPKKLIIRHRNIVGLN